MIRTSQRGTPEAPALWHPLLVECLHLSDAQASELWRAIAGSANPTVKAWAYNLDAHTLQLGDCDDDDHTRFIRRHWNPRAMVEVIEALVQEKRLPRRTATGIEEHVLAGANNAGTWR